MRCGGGRAVVSLAERETVGPELQLFINLETTQLHGSWAGLSSLGGNKGCRAALSAGGCALGAPHLTLIRFSLSLGSWTEPAFPLHVEILLHGAPPLCTCMRKHTHLKAASRHPLRLPPQRVEPRLPRVASPRTTPPVTVCFLNFLQLCT